MWLIDNIHYVGKTFAVNSSGFIIKPTHARACYGKRMKPRALFAVIMYTKRIEHLQLESDFQVRGKKEVHLVLHVQTATFTGRYCLHGALIFNASAHVRLDV